MYHAKINGNSSYDIELNPTKTEAKINGAPVQLDFLDEGNGRYHFVLNNRSVSGEIVEMLGEEKTISVRINNRTYRVELKDRFDDLLKSLGMESSGGKKLKELKAPMPGMVLDVLVTLGQSVEKDSPLIILEAMKMENVIKSPAAGVVKKIVASKANAVEKNAVLIEFE